MALRPHLLGQPHIGVECLQQPGHVAVRDRHPLRGPGGARGVDDVGDLIRSRRRQRGTGLAANSGISEIMDIDDRQIAPAQPIG